MSTRAKVHFICDEKIIATIYQHCDGDSLGKDLLKFFAEVQNQVPNDTRFNDAAYLAAKFVVWDAHRMHDMGVEYGGKKKENYLDFLSVGIVEGDYDDIAYIYTVNCEQMDDNGFPKISDMRCWTDDEIDCIDDVDLGVY